MKNSKMLLCYDFHLGEDGASSLCAPARLELKTCLQRAATDFDQSVPQIAI
jgi:hypothetical protein